MGVEVGVRAGVMVRVGVGVGVRVGVRVRLRLRLRRKPRARASWHRLESQVLPLGRKPWACQDAHLGFGGGMAELSVLTDAKGEQAPLTCEHACVGVAWKSRGAG